MESILSTATDKNKQPFQLITVDWYPLEHVQMVEILVQQKAEVTDRECVVPVVIGRVPVATFDQLAEVDKSAVSDTILLDEAHVIEHTNNSLIWQMGGKGGQRLIEGH